MKNPNWVLLTFAIAAILMGVLVQAAVVSGMAQFAYPDNPIGGLVATSTVAGTLAAALCFVILIRYRKAMTFTDEVVGEVRQVTFPERDEAMRASTTVVLTTFFTAALLAGYDFIWKNVADGFFFSEESIVDQFFKFFGLA